MESISQQLDVDTFVFTRATLCYAMAVCSSRANVLSKRLNRSSSRSFWRRGNLSLRGLIVHYVVRVFSYHQNKDTYLWNFFPKLLILLIFLFLCHGTSTAVAILLLARLHIV